MMKTPVLALVFLLCARAGAPTDPDALAAKLRALPPEFAADGLLRLAGLGSIEKPRRIALLGEAFEKAAGAQQPFKRRAATARLDGAPGFLNRAYYQNLDTLSLRVRAVEAMLPLDAGKAAALLLRIPPPQLPRVTCEEFMVYDPGLFYEVLGKLAGRNSEPYRLLARYTSAVTSPVEIGPMARVLAAQRKVQDADFAVLVRSFAGALGKISGDDRSFTHSLPAEKDIQDLTNELKRRSLTPLPLLEAWRLYLVNNLSGPRCADDDIMQSGGGTFGLLSAIPVGGTTIGYVPFFNDQLRMPPLQPIQEVETTPSRIEGAATGLRSCEEPDCQAMAKEFRGLVFDKAGNAYPTAARTTPEWQAKFKAALAALAAWSPESNPNPEYYREKTRAYNNLLTLAPDEAGREAVVRATLSFVAQNPFAKESRMEWFLPINALLGRMSLDPMGLGKLSNELAACGDPVIAAYAELERAAPRTPDLIMPLL